MRLEGKSENLLKQGPSTVTSCVGATNNAPDLGLVSGQFPTVRVADCGGCCPEMGCRHMFCIVVRKAQRSRLVDFAEAA